MVNIIKLAIVGAIRDGIFGDYSILAIKAVLDLIIILVMTGSILIFCVGLNLVWDKKIRVANLIPAIVIGVVFAYFL